MPERSSLKSSIFVPVENEIPLVEDGLKAVADVDYPWLADLLNYIISGGKQIRPTLTLLAGRFHRYNLDLLIPMATGVELLHTATLVHDDTIDGSLMRRGKPTATSIWGVSVATVAGDYLFAQSAELVARTGNLRVITLFARTLMALCSGELEESFANYDQEQPRQSYFRMIANKTASLFSTATESAGILSEAPEEAVQALKSYGYNLGMTFQIVDDILDFTAQDEELGKPVASDLLQGTLTLPAILLKEQRPKDNPIAEIFENRQKQQSLKLAIEMIHCSGIIPECYRIAQSFTSRACQALQVFPDNPSRQALMELADYVIQRQR